MRNRINSSGSKLDRVSFARSVMQVRRLVDLTAPTPSELADLHRRHLDFDLTPARVISEDPEMEAALRECNL
jgi:hypothetical protein